MSMIFYKFPHAFKFKLQNKNLKGDSMKILLALLLTLTFSEAYSRDIQAGPIWSNQHAQQVCPRVCSNQGMTWDGNWRTTQWGRMSVCSCEESRDNRRGVRKFVLQMNNRGLYQGNSTIYLKQMLQNQYGVMPRNFELERVVLVAKTRQGRGTAALKVGNWTSYPERVNGNPYDFNSNEPYTFDRVRFENNSGRFNDGVWQLLLRGNFKVKRVVVFVKRKGHGRH